MNSQSQRCIDSRLQPDQLTANADYVTEQTFSVCEYPQAMRNPDLELSISEVGADGDLQKPRCVGTASTTDSLGDIRADGYGRTPHLRAQPEAL